MAKQFCPRHTEKAGIFEIELTSWKQFHEYVLECQDLPDNMLYRGQSDAEWPLKPTLYRQGNHVQEKLASRLKSHLNNFKKACRGHCKLDKDASEGEWWALGQHMGLLTPLLDWTRSPFAALFFAFADKDTTSDVAEHRVVVVLNKSMVKRKCVTLQKKGFNKTDLVFLDPFTHENKRVVSQAGMFTLMKDDNPKVLLTLEDWIAFAFSRDRNKEALLKIKMPNEDRECCLKYLNKMNINYLTLFPDLHGAIRHCNLRQEIGGY